MKFLSKLKERYLNSAPFGAVVPYALGLFFIIFSTVGSGGEAYMVSGIVMIAAAVFAQIAGGFTHGSYGPYSKFLSQYDRELIGNAFHSGVKKNVFYEALQQLFDESDYDEALDALRELKNEKLTDYEQGVLGFYTSICYSRMGYSTNAAHAAVIAVEQNVSLPEALLMAARNFSLSANYSTAAEYYEKVAVIAENKKIFPFVFNEIGKMYLSANDPDNASRFFEKSVAEGLDPIISQGGLALVRLLQGKPDEACERYRLAIIARISDTDGYKSFAADICTANGYPENFFEEHLKQKFARETVNQ